VFCRKKQEIAMLRNVLLVATMIVMLAVVLAACGGDEDTPTPVPQQATATPTPPPEPVELNVIMAWDRRVEATVVSGDPVVEAIERIGAGRIVINKVGPEAVPSFQQIQPLKDGLFDLNFSTNGYHAGMSSLVIASSLARGSSEERRECGLTETMQELYSDKIGVKMLGSFPMGFGNKIFTSKPMTGPDFSGLKLRASGGTYEAFVEALGGETVTIAVPEIYSGLEKGVIDGIMFGGVGANALGLGEVLKYMIKPDLTEVTSALFANEESWNALPSDVQDIINQAISEVQVSGRAAGLVSSDNEREVLLAAGLEEIVFTGADAELWNSTFYEANLEQNIRTGDPAYASRFEEALTCLTGKA
jgi:TRAP-type C4-dicarboxylate transport system substrate-binding protein